MTFDRLKTTGCCVLFSACCLVGCSSETLPVTIDSKYLLDEAPSESQSVSEAKAGLGESGFVTILGRINAGEHEAFEAGKAIFVVRSDPQQHDDQHDEQGGGHGGEGHDPSTCPFCKKSNSPVDSSAIVKIFDENGEVVATDARRLLGVQQDDVVIVQGEAKIDPLGYLVVSAEGIFIQK